MQSDSFYENDWMRSMFEADMILPGLFLGPATASEVSALETLEITHVLRVISGEAPDTPSHVKLWRIEAEDSPDEDLLTMFDSTHRWIADALSGGGKVLVHCVAGVSRSASVVIAYIMKELGLSYDTAFTLVRKSRGIVSPNSGFEKQLRYYEALGYTTNGNTPAHVSLQSFILTDGTGRMDAVSFSEKWSELKDHL